MKSVPILFRFQPNCIVFLEEGGAVEEGLIENIVGKKIDCFLLTCG
jgi:hypothetical protein